MSDIIRDTRFGGKHLMDFYAADTDIHATDSDIHTADNDIHVCADLTT